MDRNTHSISVVSIRTQKLLMENYRLNRMRAPVMLDTNPHRVLGIIGRTVVS